VFHVAVEEVLNTLAPAFVERPHPAATAAGASIGGFLRVAGAMLAQGIV
jgi:hypothetical protein